MLYFDESNILSFFEELDKLQEEEELEMIRSRKTSKSWGRKNNRSTTKMEPTKVVQTRNRAETISSSEEMESYFNVLKNLEDSLSETNKQVVAPKASIVGTAASPTTSTSNRNKDSTTIEKTTRIPLRDFLRRKK